MTSRVLARRLTVLTAQCNNVPVSLDGFEYMKGVQLKVPVSAIYWEPEAENLLVVETTTGNLEFLLTANQIPKALRNTATTLKVRCSLVSGEDDTLLFRSSVNANETGS